MLGVLYDLTMPKGPLGFPRLSSIPPFVREDERFDVWEPCEIHARDETDLAICRAIKQEAIDLVEDEGLVEVDDVRSINNGWCYAISDNVWLELGTPDEIRVLERHATMGSNHGYIEYRGKYFDAERPHGVDSPSELPFFEGIPSALVDDPFVRSEGETAIGMSPELDEFFDNNA